MKWKHNIIPTIISIFICSFSYGQIKQYTYERALTPVHDQWQRIVLPAEMFGKIAPGFPDIRIFGITSSNDTITAPYILQEAAEKSFNSEADFTLINQSHNSKGYYFTFELNGEKNINQVTLDFSQQNFDWRVQLEASNDQQEWFTIMDNYRILSINNDLTHYQFTKLAFPDARFHYFRLFIKSDIKPSLRTAKISRMEVSGGKYIAYPINEKKIAEEKESHQTIIHLGVLLPVPVSYLKIYVHDTIDYYRPITIKYLSDSFETEKGWMYNYTTIGSGTLSSIEKNEFVFPSTICKKLQVVIENKDNKPLQIDSLEPKGYEYALLARFDGQASWWLVYGNNKASRPQYDIERFADKISTPVATLQPGPEQLIQKQTVQSKAPLFQNKSWLWAILLAIMLILGWFSIKMMRKAT